MASDLVIRLRGVVKRFGPITAVDGLDLDLTAGTCVRLLGPNCAGKSTTMRMLSALAKRARLRTRPRRFTVERGTARDRRGTDGDLPGPANRQATLF